MAVVKKPTSKTGQAAQIKAGNTFASTPIAPSSSGSKTTSSSGGGGGGLSSLNLADPIALEKPKTTTTTGGSGNTSYADLVASAERAGVSIDKLNQTYTAKGGTVPTLESSLKTTQSTPTQTYSTPTYNKPNTTATNLYNQTTSTKTGSNIIGGQKDFKTQGEQFDIFSGTKQATLKDIDGFKVPSTLSGLNAQLKAGNITQEQYNTIIGQKTQDSMLNQQQQELLKTYQKEQEKNILEGRKQETWKRIENVLGTEMRELTPEEKLKISTDAGLSTDEFNKVYDSLKQSREKVYEPFKNKEEDITKEKDRAIEDAKIQLEQTYKQASQKMDDIEQQMNRDIAAGEKVGALKGYIQSSGYQQGLKNIKNDSQKLINRLNSGLQDASKQTATYIARVGTDYTTNMDRLSTGFKDSLLGMKMMGTNEINSLMAKYAPSDEILTKELDRITNEYGLKSMQLYKGFLENFKGITDAAMYEAEKVQTFATKQKELENLTLSYLYQNDGMALRNMSDADIQNLYNQGYISEGTVSTLKSARQSSLENYQLKQTQIEQGVALDWANLSLQQKELNAQLGIVDKTEIKQNLVDAIQTIPNGVQGGQCVAFVNDALESAGLPSFSHDADQSLENKISKINSYTPTVGSILVRTSPTQPKFGDVVMVTGINGDTISYKGSNVNGDEKVYTGQIKKNDPSIKGYFDPSKVKDTQKLSKEQQSTVDKYNFDYQNEQLVKDYNTMNAQVSYLNNLDTNTNNPGDDIALIYGFARVMDPTSAVKEGEYETVKKYSQSLGKKTLKEIEMAVSGEGFLSAESREKLKNTLSTKVNNQGKMITNLRNQYGEQINRKTGLTNGIDYITDYTTLGNNTGGQTYGGQQEDILSGFKSKFAQ